MRQSFGDWDPCEKSQKMRAWIDPHITVWFLLGNGEWVVGTIIGDCVGTTIMDPFPHSH